MLSQLCSWGFPRHSSLGHLQDLCPVFVLCCAKSLQSCLTLCDPVDCSPPGSSAHGDSPGQNTGLGCHALPQGIFPTQGSNPDLLHCRQILYCLSHQESWCGSTKNTGVGSLSLLHGNFPTQELSQGLLHCRWFLYQLSYPGSPVLIPV